MCKNRKDKIGKGVLVRGVVICIAVAVISFSLISGLAAQGTGDTVNVTVTNVNTLSFRKKGRR